MKKWVRFLIAFVCLAILGTNVYLIGKDNSKADRLHVVRHWDKARTGDLEISFSVKGVVAPAETEHITIDAHARFQEFLVKEGDTVDSGTPLFSYKSDDLDRQIAVIEAEISSLQAKRDSLSAALQEYEKLLRTNRDSSSSYTDPYDPFRPDVTEPVDNPEPDRPVIEQALIEKKAEIGKIDADIAKYEEQRAAVEAGKDGLTVESPIAGTVTRISSDLKNPVMTIVSNDKVVKGKLDEQQVAKASEGMKVKIASPFGKSPAEGQVAEISGLPENEPSTERKSLYPFIAHYEPGEKDWLVGQRVAVNIVTKEANHVPVVPEKSVKKDSKGSCVWVLNEKSAVEKRKVTLGIAGNKRKEIKSGLDPGDVFVLNPHAIRNPGKYITPYKPGKINKQDRKKISGKTAFKYVLIGVLQR
jgi:HlyD family secretion protein